MILHHWKGLMLEQGTRFDYKGGNVVFKVMEE